MLFGSGRQPGLHKPDRIWIHARLDDLAFLSELGMPVVGIGQRPAQRGL